jgi:hypothetical protein
METGLDVIDHSTLEQLARDGAVHVVSVIGQPGGWGVLIQREGADCVLAAKHGTTRTFAKFETVVAYLKKIGIAKYQVDATRYGPSIDQAEHVREDAAEHDKWFRTEVDAGLAEADDPDTVWVSHDAVKEDMAKQRAILLARIKGMAD